MYRDHNLWNRRASIAVLLLFLFMTGCGVFPDEEEALAPPLAVPEEVKYKTVDVRKGYIENTVKCNGTFVPYNEINLFFRNNSGRLKKLYTSAGTKVKKGDILAELITEDIERHIAEQEIALDSKEKDLTYSKSVADIEIKMSEDKLSELKRKYEAMNKIAGAYSENEIESIKNELDSQKSLLEKLKLNLSNQLELKKNDVKTARLALEGLRKDLEKSRLLSPSDGVITYVDSLKEGEYVEAFKTVVSVAEPKNLQLKYKGLEAYKFELGMKVDIKTDSGEELKGEVVLNEGSVPVEEIEKYRETVIIKVDRVPEGTNSGERADIKLVLDSKDNVVVVPKRALQKYMGKDIVYVLEDDMRSERYVEKGIESVDEVQILKGVEPGEKVVVD
ncbi:MAG: efflux RND transporter periplasmic adaptor subunit [Clostridiaceae bacterium]|nr:efflux RND transporter periplasmic adaptor subunit [Clostridiaceae bacterium]